MDRFPRFSFDYDVDSREAYFFADLYCCPCRSLLSIFSVNLIQLVVLIILLGYQCASSIYFSQLSITCNLLVNLYFMSCPFYTLGSIRLPIFVGIYSLSYYYLSLFFMLQGPWNYFLYIINVLIIDNFFTKDFFRNIVKQTEQRNISSRFVNFL